MSSGLDKEWIDNDNIESDAYRKGVCDFIQFLMERCGGEKYFSCPCRKCLNGTGQFDTDYILTHLLKNGMDKSYRTWYFHRESRVATRKRNEPERETLVDINENVNDNVTQTSDPLIHDVCDEGHVPDVPETSSIPKTHKETKYERLKRLAQNPLYPTSHEASKHSTMHALVKLNDLKTEFSLSDAATEGVLGLLKELLPEGNTLGKKIHEMKCTIKEADMNYVTYDVCERHCMLFWKEHINSTRCAICPTSRYKVTRVDDNGNRRAGATTGIQRRGNNHVQKYKRVARKVMRYFPIIPRLKRLYSVKWIAEAMTWHHRAKSCVEFMRHPRDSADWTSANRNWKEFAKDPRSVRLALATDDFNPNGSFGAFYSCWPIILQPLNLPPSLTMKSEFSMLTVLIPGPTSPKSRIDVFLQPLVDDLNVIWRGVDAWDEARMEPFNLKAMLLWCIHDFPALGMLSGCVYGGKFAYPICSANTSSVYLSKSMKTCYMCSRLFLPANHNFRFDTSKQTFNGKVEHGLPPRKLEGTEVEEMTSSFENLGDTSSHDFDNLNDDQTPTSTKGFTRRPILFDLEYWSSHGTRHNLDLMHIEKNVIENLLNTILSLKGSKDTIGAREDLKQLGLKKKLWLKDVGDGKKEMPRAPFVLSKEDKTTFFNALKALRVPSGFSSNFRNSVNLGTMSFSFKSHDYHMIMQHLLPALIIHAYPAADKSLYKAIQRISIFFNVLCAKVVSRAHLTKAKRALTEALCVLETYFPPSFFVIMIHLMHHLGDEALAAGPPRFHSMWSFEREMKRYKKWARSKCHIEGSIVEAYLLHEASLYAMEYISTNGSGTHKRSLETYLDDEDEEDLGRYIGKIDEIVLNATQFMQARKWILQQQADYEDWMRKYNETGRHTFESRWKYAVDDFIIWLKEGGERTNNIHMSCIAEGPKFNVASYKKFRCNGYTFSTFAYDENKLVQNNGVSMEAYNSDGIMTTYYGVIRGIFDLDYHECTYAVFYCDWVCSEDRTAFKVDTNSKLVMVNLSKVMSSKNVNDEPFILASQASQVFYCKDSKHEGWSIVIPSPKRLTKAIDALEIDQTMYNSVIEENERLCALIDCD